MTFSPIIEPLTEADLTRTTEIAKASLTYDPIHAGLVREKIFEEESYESKLSLKAVADGKQVGFLSGHVDERRGGRWAYAKFFAVDPRYRRRGVGSKLLEAFEAAANERNAEAVRTMDCIPNYLMPGIDPRYTPATILFERRGYTKIDENINMLADLNAADLDTTALMEKAKASGLTVRRATEADRASLDGLLDREWKAWKKECEATYRNDPISLFLGFDGDKVIAFAAYDANNRGTGWFGPMGTDPEYRRHKLGEITLKLCLKALKDQGQSESIIPWVGPIGFYSRTVGAHIERVFWVYEKRLSSAG